jgi:hypothetical protein
LRENLKRTPEERLLRVMELQKFAEELRRALETAQTTGMTDSKSPTALLFDTQ